ncbi:MAG: lytic transglycosylase domain-containing protein [Pseudomonadota bacterium]
MSPAGQASAARWDQGLTLLRHRRQIGFKTIKPPRGGKRFRANRPSGSSSGGAAKKTREHPWFWAEISPAGQASAARWDQGLTLLRHRRQIGKAIYSTDRMRRIADQWAQPVRAAARRHQVSEAVMLAVIAVESAGQPRARSPKGAMGLMQLIPATARRFGVRDAYDPAQNVGGGAAYLDFLLGRFRSDIVLALAGYNAGEGAVARHGGVPPYRETRDYVVRVLDALVAMETLCATRPTGPRQTCALSGPLRVPAG